MFLTNSIAQTQTSSRNLEKGIAIQGFDVVTYFTKEKAIKGSKEFSVTYENATYWFVNNENKKLFLKNPSEYEPQYGGWCAFAIGNTGEKVSINPETFKIIDGKLYLFYNKFLTNTLTSWNKDEKRLKIKADKNWNQIIKK